MFSLKDICETVEVLLNNNSQGIVFAIYADGETHQKPKRKGNTVKKIIEGTMQRVGSSIVPVSGLKVGTQSLYIEIAIPLDPKTAEEEGGIENTVNAYKGIIDNIVAEPRTQSIQGYLTTLTGTYAEALEIQQTSIGLMIPLTFTLELNYFLNGVNSMYEKLYYNNKEIYFTSMSIGRNVIQDGGAFSNSNGIAKNYVQNTALSIEITLPALNNGTNDFYARFREFLFDGNEEPFELTYTNSTTNTNRTYRMIFLTSNSQSQGVQNVGYTITMAEAL